MDRRAICDGFGGWFSLTQGAGKGTNAMITDEPRRGFGRTKAHRHLFYTSAAAQIFLVGCGSVASNTSDAGGTLDAFDYARCPASYDAALPGPTRYRLSAQGASAWAHSETCSLDLLGATHLVGLETAGELASVQRLVDSSTIAAGVWVGGVQRHTATTPGEGWLGLDGQPLLAGAWYHGPGDNGQTDSEPNDGDAMENLLEQFVIIKPMRNGLQDSQGSNSKGALCECDGKPIAATAAAEISANSTP